MQLSVVDTNEASHQKEKGDSHLDILNILSCPYSGKLVFGYRFANSFSRQRSAGGALQLQYG
jgi:hypothetical protein